MKLRASLAAAVALVLVTVAPQANGGGGVAITSCGQVVTTNAFLTQDLYCPGSDGVVVGASGITIDLKGFRLRGGDAGTTIGVSNPGFESVTVKNGVVRSFDVGLQVWPAADGFTVANVLVSGSYTGISVSGDSASMKSVTASGNGFYGIYIGGNAATIKSSTASGNQTGGIYVAGDSTVIKNNRAEANGFVGGTSPSDLDGLGIYALAFSTPPVGKNTARGNDHPAECQPASLC
jgi:hypothetical protein